MDKLRWGLLSTARINRRIMPAMRISNRSQLQGIASRDLERAQQYAAEWEIPQVFGSYEDMLASNQIDAVYIGLPNTLHAEWSIKALQAGKHVLCEKPFAVSLAEVDAMAAAARTSGCVLAEAFMYRHHPQSALVLDLLANGKIGAVRGLNTAFHFHLDPSTNIRLQPELAGGSLWDVGIYPISYSQMILSATPQTVSGRQQIGPSGVDLTFFAQMHYASGQVSQFTSSFDSPFHAIAEIIGTHGRLTVSRPFNGVEDSQIVWYKENGSVENIPCPQKELYLGEVEDMENAVIDGLPPLITLAQSRDHVRTALALYQSARENRTIALE